MREPTVYVVDDDPAVRDALVTLIDSVGTRCKHHATAIDFLKHYDSENWGCLITDVCLPGMDGMQLQQTLIDQQLSIPVIAISAHGDIPMAVEMVRKGAVDFLEKPFRNHIMLQRVNEALQLSRQQRENQAQINRIQSLTPREREVFGLLVEGKSNKQVAGQLNLSTRTVEAHRASILRKTQVDSITNLAWSLGKLPGAERTS